MLRYSGSHHNTQIIIIFTGRKKRGTTSYAVHLYGLRTVIFKLAEREAKGLLRFQ